MIGRLNMSYRSITVTSYRMLLYICISTKYIQHKSNSNKLSFKSLANYSETCLYRPLYKANFRSPNVRTLNYTNLYKLNPKAGLQVVRFR